MKKSRITKIVWSLGASDLGASFLELATQNREHFDALRILYEPGKEDQLADELAKLNDLGLNRPTLILDVASRVRASIRTRRQSL